MNAITILLNAYNQCLLESDLHAASRVLHMMQYLLFLPVEYKRLKERIDAQKYLDTLREFSLADYNRLKNKDLV